MPLSLEQIDKALAHVWTLVSRARNYEARVSGEKLIRDLRAQIKKEDNELLLRLARTHHVTGYVTSFHACSSHACFFHLQGLIRPWHDREINAGSLWDKEISAHLKSARIILLLVSPNFIASDYCYGVEMQEALKRHIAGETRVIPIILRRCDWEPAPFGSIQALPKNAKPVKTWPDRDAAFTDIAKGIRKVVEELTGKIMDMHLNYEQAKEYKLEWLESKDVPFSWRAEKMRLTIDKRVLIVNESLSLGALPPECFEYRLGNRSALEWVIDQYQVSKDQRSGIESDPNRLDDEEYIVRLVGTVVTVSVETVRLVKELAQAVTMEDWIEEAVDLNGSTAEITGS